MIRCKSRWTPKSVFIKVAPPQLGEQFARWLLSFVVATTVTLHDEHASAQIQPASVVMPANPSASVEVPLPTLSGYHTKFSDMNDIPNVAPRDGDPWALARRLGVADNGSYPIPDDLRHVDMMHQSARDAEAKSFSCIHCHTDVGHMHPINSIEIGCTDCHGGNAKSMKI